MHVFPTRTHCLCEVTLMDTSPTSPTSPLQIVVCAAGMVTDVGKLITAAHEWHWDVEVIATPRGLGFLDVEAV